ncbi:DUF2846 domain-containing protein [Aeromicrobium fastidiosum]|uniref:DUF2846 domain-containing protein n=1 Tax=Aeromicrobium fastidiosum TaxID=52699 RepID=UPI0020237075|nr:DUF2846 domain-containing protein [Aeromicrobium fastidiosum]MCL8251435.1 DUF2846 domain-containing protein [Aeromicrobium fastidiosum]
MPYESGSSATLLWQGVFAAAAMWSVRGSVAVRIAPARGRALARAGTRQRWFFGTAWAVGVALIAAGAVLNVVNGYWWLAAMLAVAATSWGCALVENVRRRDDPPGGGRPWPRAYRYVSNAGLASWALLITAWVGADLLDGDWLDALPGLAGWCVFVVAVTVAAVRSRRAAQEHREAPPLRRDAGHGELRLRRPSNRWAFGLILAVHVDAHLVAELRAGESTSVRVEAGEHDLAFVVDRMGLADHRVDVPAGESVEAELVLDENDVTLARIPDGPLVVRLTP